jgi:hypothetical protein
MKTCTCCKTLKNITEFYYYQSTQRADTFCKSCRCQASKDYASTKGHTRTLRRHKDYYDKTRLTTYAKKQPMDIARLMTLIVATLGKWRDDEPQKFTDFKAAFMGLEGAVDEAILILENDK